MNVKSIGFSIKNPNKNVCTKDVINYFISLSDNQITRADYDRKVMLTEEDDFYTGLVLTFKNQKKNCKSTMANGKFVLKVEDLQGDEKLVHFNFFCLKKDSLRGLYLYYHGSCSLSALFHRLESASNEYIRNLVRDEIKNLGKKPDQKKSEAINKKYAERFEYEIIVDESNLETMLSSFKEIKSATFRFSSIGFEKPEMLGIEQFARNTEVTFNITTEDKTKTSPIARSVTKAFKSVGGILKGKVVAKDHQNHERIINFFNCPTYFNESDFDLMAEKVDGLTNDNYHKNEIVAIIKDEISNGKNKHEFN
ncbi:hypothetical protein ND444_05675 [Yersinia ruckeri]|uniref:hypothetical protein n=1 Tax=Yersinia ruckeri TaxID=29486 RepID=UPI00119E9CA4|nr:hypothetical protein [Yersinia ruckeri]MCW6601749.1 hypothetical protein [Yersinia ruckeri]MCW6606866.1 hypothetical protein [Yersinia ruckeri]MCW6615874.1 hypothetical protein [Yersinia ruckeri]UZX95870.1 hypothetical protein ND444_05675 [Yersinia ruckeri]